MLKSYFTIAWRNIQRNPGYTFINIAGLAFGLAVFITSLLYVDYENAFDNWSSQFTDVYRLNVEKTRSGEKQTQISNSYSIGTQLASTCPEVKAVVHVVDQGGERLLTTGDTKLYVDRVMSADSSFFSVFPYKFVYGSAATALQHPNQAVISRELSRKVFGDTDPTGKTFTLNTGKTLTVTGVCEKIGPSHLDFNICVSYFNSMPDAWGRQFYYTYVKLNPHSSVSGLSNKAKLIVQKGEADYSYSNTSGQNPNTPKVTNPAQWLASNTKTSIDAVNFEKVSNIHLNASVSPYRNVAYGKIDGSYPLINSQTDGGKTLWFLSLSAFLVLLLACINYTNLSIARSGKRAKESGVRKVMGAMKAQLVKQFLAEAFIQTLFAFLLGLFIADIFTSMVNNLFQTNLSLVNPTQFSQNIKLGVQLAVALFAVVLLSGGYPAFVLSSFKPVKVLKGEIMQNLKGKFLRNGLVILQFSVSTCFVIGMLVIYKQINFMNTSDPGFSTDQVLVLKPHNQDLISVQSKDQKIDQVKRQLQNIPGVKSVALTDAFPGRPSLDEQDATYDGKQSKMTFNYVDFDYFKTMGMKIAAGRDFSPQFSSDTVDNAVINETAARAMGLQNPVGHRVNILLRNYNIIGVLKDNHVGGYDTKIAPEVYAIGADKGPNLMYGAITLKLNGHDAQAVTKAVTGYWKTLEPDYPLRYSWLDEEFSQLFERYERFGKMTAMLSGISIVISLMGIFALSAFAAAQRTKEIGIRKVFGASVGRISALLSVDFVKLIGLAMLIAIPVAYWASAKWLQGFAYRIDLSWMLFAAGGMGVLMIALLTISFQTIKAAVANPVNSLRNE